MQQPMHYFLCHLSLVDVSYLSTVVPRIIRDLAAARKNISYNNCMTQLLTAHLLAGVEIFILVSMAFDCYIAIIKPLHCMVIMNRHKYNMLIVLPWAVSFWHSIALLLMVLKSPFCGTNQIDHYLCDVKPHLKLVYKDIHAVNILMIANSGMVVVLFFSY